MHHMLDSLGEWVGKLIKCPHCRVVSGGHAVVEASADGQTQLLKCANTRCEGVEFSIKTLAMPPRNPDLVAVSER